MTELATSQQNPQHRQSVIITDLITSIEHIQQSQTTYDPFKQEEGIHEQNIEANKNSNEQEWKQQLDQLHSELKNVQQLLFQQGGSPHNHTGQKSSTSTAPPAFHPSENEHSDTSEITELNDEVASKITSQFFAHLPHDHNESSDDLEYKGGNEAQQERLHVQENHEEEETKLTTSNGPSYARKRRRHSRFRTQIIRQEEGDESDEDEDEPITPSSRFYVQRHRHIPSSVLSGTLPLVTTTATGKLGRAFRKRNYASFLGSVVKHEPRTTLHSLNASDSSTPTKYIPQKKKQAAIDSTSSPQTRSEHSIAADLSDTNKRVFSPITSPPFIGNSAGVTFITVDGEQYLTHKDLTKITKIKYPLNEALVKNYKKEFGQDAFLWVDLSMHEQLSKQHPGIKKNHFQGVNKSMRLFSIDFMNYLKNR